MKESIKEKLKSKGFWAGVVGTVFLILGAFGVRICDQTTDAVINGISSLLVMLGISSPLGKLRQAPDPIGTADVPDIESVAEIVGAVLKNENVVGD